MNTKEIVDRALEEVAKECIREVIERHAGHGVENEIKQVIRDEAKRLINSDPEIRDLIRETVIYWVRNQK